MFGYYSEIELTELGLKSCGSNVLISKKASLYDISNISIGNHVRIDDFAFLAGNIEIGDYVHISPYASLHGTAGGRIVLKDFTLIASYSGVYASNDDYSGKFMTNPMVTREFQNVISDTIILEKHSCICLHCSVLPGAYLAEGTVLGAMSLLKEKTEPFSIYAGSPARKIKERSSELLNQEEKFRKKYESNL